MTTINNSIDKFCERLNNLTYASVQAYKDQISVRVNTLNGVHVDIISSDQFGDFKENYADNDNIFSTESSKNNDDKRKLVGCLFDNINALNDYPKIAHALSWSQYRLRFIIEDNKSGGKSRKQKKRKSRTMKRKSKK